jgi:hypothetical protein
MKYFEELKYEQIGNIRHFSRRLPASYHAVKKIEVFVMANKTFVKTKSNHCYESI